jgi:hypothetical protein
MGKTLTVHIDIFQDVSHVGVQHCMSVALLGSARRDALGISELQNTRTPGRGDAGTPGRRPAA